MAATMYAKVYMKTPEATRAHHSVLQARGIRHTKNVEPWVVVVTRLGATGSLRHKQGRIRLQIWRVRSFKQDANYD